MAGQFFRAGSKNATHLHDNFCQLTGFPGRVQGQQHRQQNPAAGAMAQAEHRLSVALDPDFLADAAVEDSDPERCHEPSVLELEGRDWSHVARLMQYSVRQCKFNPDAPLKIALNIHTKVQRIACIVST